MSAALDLGALKGPLDTIGGNVLDSVNQIGNDLDKMGKLVKSGIESAKVTWRVFGKEVTDKTIAPVTKSVGELAGVKDFVEGADTAITDLNNINPAVAFGAMSDAVANAVNSIEATFEGLVATLFEGLLPTAANFLKTMRNKILEGIGKSEGLCVDIPQCLEAEEIVLYDVPEFGTAKLGNFFGPKFCIAGKCWG